MKLIAEIFSQGEEVVCGQTVDSNAAWLSQHLNDLGFSVKRHTAVGDDLSDLVALINEIAQRADCCICTGGLGPTLDDLTAQAVSLASGEPLKFDPQAMQQIAAYYQYRQRPMPEANRKQAYLPQTARRIDNPLGTAPGFALQIQRCWFVFLPGVPSEMKAMYTAVAQQLCERFRLQPDNLVTLRSVGIGESAIQQALQSLALPVDVQLGFRAAVDEVQTKLRFVAGFNSQLLQACVAEAAALIGDYVFAIDGLPGQLGGDLISVIDQAMTTKDLQLVTLETASGGLLAAKCHDKSWLQHAQISKPLPVNDYQQTAAELALQLHQQSQQLALVQLYQGSLQDYQRQDKTIVLYNCLHTTNHGVFQSRITVGGTAAHKQNQSAILALDLLRRYLQNPCH